MSTLGPDPRATSVAADGRSVTRHSPAAAKIALFRSLFRGREDVYPRRFESRKTGKSGYAPACANDWVQGVCEKPRIKCAVCPNRRFLPLTDDVVRWHLSGRDAGDQPAAARNGATPLGTSVSWLASSVGGRSRCAEPLADGHRAAPPRGRDGRPAHHQHGRVAMSHADRDSEGSKRRCSVGVRRCYPA